MTGSVPRPYHSPTVGLGPGPDPLPGQQAKVDSAKIVILILCMRMEWVRRSNQELLPVQNGTERNGTPLINPQTDIAQNNEQGFIMEFRFGKNGKQKSRRNGNMDTQTG